PLLAVPFLFNSGFMRGFLSFELGAGCALLGVAWWVSAGRMHWLRRLVLATIWSTALYTIHFYAWAFYGLFILCYEIQQMIERREPHLGVFLARLSRDSLLALPVPIMLVYAAENSGAPELTVGGFELPFPRILRIEHLIYAGNPVLDRVLVVIFALVMVFMIAGGWLQVRRNFALPIAIGVVMFFLLPDEIAGTYYASWRVLFLAGLVGIAS